MTALLRILDRRNDAIYVIVKQVLVAESSSNLTNHRSLAGVCWRKFDSERPPNSTLVGEYIPKVPLDYCEILRNA